MCCRLQSDKRVTSHQKTGLPGGSYGVSHANFVIAYSRDNLAHLIYPGGVGKEDCSTTCLS